MASQKAPISSLKKGEYVTLVEDGPVWIRGDYCRSEGKYELINCNDMNRFCFRKGVTEVFHGFTY